MDGAQAVLPGLRCRAFPVCCPCVLSARPRPSIVKALEGVILLCFLEESCDRQCRVGKRAGGHPRQQLPDVEFEEHVDPGVEVRIAIPIGLDIWYR